MRWRPWWHIWLYDAMLWKAGKLMIIERVLSVGIGEVMFMSGPVYISGLRGQNSSSIWSFCTGFHSYQMRPRISTSIWGFVCRSVNDFTKNLCITYPKASAGPLILPNTATNTTTSSSAAITDTSLFLPIFGSSAYTHALRLNDAKTPLTSPFGQRCVWIGHFGKLWDILKKFGQVWGI